MTMGRIFGTDGARGIAGTEITAELALDIGRASAMVLAGSGSHKEHPLVLIGKDPRISSDMLEAAVIAGLCSVGANVLKVGVLPTPAVAYLVKHYGADAGVMISASHNPAKYNGIKLFGGDGYKLHDDLENEIESIILDKKNYPLTIGGALGKVTEDIDAARDAYVEFTAKIAEGDLSGMRMLIDCANGAASTTANALFERVGASFDIIYNKPDGININENCGSTHIEELGRKVKDGGYDLGFAFDGDADRLLAVDSEGELVDGDRIMAIVGGYLKKTGKLDKNTITVTTMTNMGFFTFAKNAGIDTAVTKVGDRYILEHMLKNDFSFGGEQSGHFIFLGHHTTGDGQMSAILLLSALADAKKPLSEMKELMRVYPQVLLGVSATPEMKAALPDNDGVKAAIEQALAALNGSGRVDVRASGTEPVIRVMVEGEDEALIKSVSENLAKSVEENLK